MYCGKCGAFNNDQNLFCVNCGKRVSSVTETGVTEAPSSDITHISFSRQYVRSASPPKSVADGVMIGKEHITQPSQKKPQASAKLNPKIGRFSSGMVFAERYTIEKLLGAGGMGEVYKVRDVSSGEIRALKIFHPSLVGQDDLVQRFYNEAKIISQITHINLVRAIMLAEYDAYKYILMEYVEGVTLREWIRKRSPQADIDEILDIILQICTGLEVVHQYTIHRDIKPENVMLSKSGVVKIMDFGIAKSLSMMGVTETTASMGTAYYMAPEQVADAGSVDERADVFSVGVILYEMMNQKVPMGHFKIPISKEKDISSRLAQIVRKSLDADVKERYQNIASFKKDLEQERMDIRKKRLEKKVFAFSKTSDAGVEPRLQERSVSFMSVALVLLLLMSCLAGGFYLWETWGLSGAAPVVDSSQEGYPGDLVPLDAVAEGQLPGHVATRRLKVDMRLLPAGEFEMGDLESVGEEDEKPAHKVWIDACYMGTYEVTNQEYQMFVKETGYTPPVNVFGAESEYSLWSGTQVPEEILDCPVINVSWEDAMAFCRWLTEYEGVSAGRYRLPREAEWEKAARGLRGAKYPWGNAEPEKDKANFHQYWIGALTLRKKGSYAANPLGFYDLAGNVWEWCMDVYRPKEYHTSQYRNPEAQGLERERVLRGGDWGSYAYLLRCANRYSNPKDVHYYYNGFRVVRELSA